LLQPLLANQLLYLEPLPWGELQLLQQGPPGARAAQHPPLLCVDGHSEKKAYYENVWTGMLPENTETWPEGETWRNSWSLGTILPVSQGGLLYEI